MARDLHLSDASYLRALERNRERIANGLELNAVDSITPGNKFTEASWGLCSKEAELWPDKEDHLFPDRMGTDIAATKYREYHHVCPMDTRERGAMGCFYTCRIFQPKYVTPFREEAIALYDQRIKEAKDGRD